MWSSVKSAAILDSGLNLSDNSPISTCICADVSPQPIPKTVHLEGRLRWDKADLTITKHITSSAKFVYRLIFCIVYLVVRVTFTGLCAKLNLLIKMQFVQPM